MVSVERLIELVKFHERQRSMHAADGHIQAACLVDDVIAALKELQQWRAGELFSEIS